MTEATPLNAPIPLSKPISRKGGDVTAVTLREPMSGETRGAKLADIVQMDVQTMITLLPRITEPALTEAEVASLPLADLMSLAAPVAAFCVPSAGRALGA